MEVGVGERDGPDPNERENQGGEVKGARAKGGGTKGMGVMTDGGESQGRAEVEAEA